MRNVRLTVAYDGTGFHGFAATRACARSLGELSAAVARVVRQPVELTGAGRTDAGVHAWGQVVTADLPADTDLGRAPAQRQQTVPAGRSPCARPNGRSPTSTPGSRRRRATTATRAGTTPSEPVPRRARHGTSRSPLDLAAMQAACDPLIGEHDFSSFCRRPEGPAPGKPCRAGAPGSPSRSGRRRRRRTVRYCASRSPRRVLPPDGAQHRRHARRRGSRPAGPWRRSGRHWRRSTAPRRARWHRRTGSCSGTWTTAGRRWNV